MTLELDDQKVVVTGGKRELDRTIAEAGADEGADVVIWMREWKGDVNELKLLLLKMEAEVVTRQSNGTSSHTSLWREGEATRAQESSW
jgi:NAD(P)-dependent dehydrogenase (short-subunit alcohol dehydrogenase family)